MPGAQDETASIVDCLMLASMVFQVLLPSSGGHLDSQTQDSETILKWTKCIYSHSYVMMDTRILQNFYKNMCDTKLFLGFCIFREIFWERNNLNIEWKISSGKLFLQFLEVCQCDAKTYDRQPTTTTGWVIWHKILWIVRQSQRWES